MLNDFKIKGISVRAQYAVVWTLRVFVGAVFIFSGLVKAIDPWGVLYKITEYCASMLIPITHETALVLSCLLAGFEFTAGVVLLVGAFRRTIVWLLSAFISVMTILTVWIYLANPVSDCGCFGDAIILSNGATLAKNIVLCFCMVLLLKYNHRVIGIYHYHLHWLVLVFSAGYALALSMIGYFIQPIIDFRPYKVGTNLTELLASSGNEPLFVYKKGNETKTFSADELPGDDWTFVERKQTNNKRSEFAIFDEEDEVTSEVIDNSEGKGLLLLLVIHPDRYGISRSRMANRMYDYMMQNDGEMIAILPEASDSLKQKWIDDVEAKYDVYTAEDADLKSFARGDAALVYIKNGVVQWKYNVYALSPEIKSIFDTSSPDAIANVKPIENKHWLLKLTVVYLALMLMIAMFASLPIALYKLHKAKKQTKSSLDK
jgi:uncharacterized membrane protein YphA (DoxX/SURF4 family)